jgi:hypothetical protein
LLKTSLALHKPNFTGSFGNVRALVGLD